jgi:hypothetical protein
MSHRDSYVVKAEKQFAEAQVQLATLARDAKKAVAAGQAEGERLLLAAQSKHDEALHRFELLKRTGEESWESLKTAFETAWAEMGHALNAKA